MSIFDLWGPWTGAALRSHAPIPYYRQRRRQWIKASAAVVSVCGLVWLGLYLVNRP